MRIQEGEDGGAGLVKLTAGQNLVGESKRGHAKVIKIN
jgi:hypothetical protein